MRNLPFRHHLALVVTLTSGLAVALAGLGTLWFERREAYRQIREDYLPLAQIIGSNSEGALAFGDAKAADETLAALSLKTHVISARLYTAGGRPFATYRRPGTAEQLPETPGPAGQRFEGRSFVIDHRIAYDTEPVGSLFVKIDTTAATSRLWRASMILGLVFLTSTGAALLVSSRLQARVSAPLQDLAAAVREVSEQRNYAVRVKPAGPIELRVLTSGFNEMLGQLQERDAALRSARDELEIRVEDRVRELQREVCERRKAEAQNALLSQAVSSSSELIGIVGLDGRMSFANQAFLDAYGYTREELLGQKLSLVYSPNSPPELPEAIRSSTLAGGWRGEVTTRRRDGQDLPVVLSSSVIRDEAGKIVGLLGVASDITDVRLKEQRLQLQSAALESTADAVAITERDGTITWVNRAFTSLTGFSAEEVLGCKPSLLSSGKQEASLYRQLWQTVLGGQVWDGELTNKRKDGKLYLEEQTITPVRNSRGEISHFVAVKRDISQRRRLEAQLRQAQKMEAVGRLSGGVAHDFNNLLNVILGYGDLLVRGLPEDDRLRRYGHQIIKAAERGAGLTRQLLAFSRQQVLQPRILDLNSVVSEAQKMLVRLIGEDVDLITSLAPDLGAVEVDPGQIEQVVMNLAVNGRDAMPQGGTLAVETSNVDLLELEAGGYPYPVAPGAYVRLAVTDTGTGMDEQTLAHLFEPFFTTKEAGKGTGLGLATVYGIVKQSKGYVSVTSEVGQGTTFTVLLPRVSRPERLGAPEADEAAAPTGSETVLLAEDDDAARGLWKELLDGLGYRVLEARNGAAALDAAEALEGRLDLLITDVVMPRISGRELAERLATTHLGLRVIFMSGYTADTILRQGIAQTEYPFLQKPFSAHQLAKKIRETLDAPRARA